ncbi:hypothetical protein ACSW8S_17410 (plasmid) [Clostridium perfringens]
MLVSELIEKKAVLKYIPKQELEDYDVSGIEEDTEYFLILNIQEIFETSNTTKIFAVMKDNKFQGLCYYSGYCGLDCNFNIYDEGHSVS